MADRPNTQNDQNRNEGRIDKQRNDSKEAYGRESGDRDTRVGKSDRDDNSSMNDVGSSRNSDRQSDSNRH